MFIKDQEEAEEGATKGLPYIASDIEIKTLVFMKSENTLNNHLKSAAKTKARACVFDVTDNDGVGEDELLWMILG